MRFLNPAKPFRGALYLQNVALYACRELAESAKDSKPWENPDFAIPRPTTEVCGAMRKDIKHILLLNRVVLKCNTDHCSTSSGEYHPALACHIAFCYKIHTSAQ